MDTVFVYVKPSSLKKDAHIVEFSGVRTNGKVGHITQRSVIAAYTSKVSAEFPFRSVASNIKSNLLSQGEKIVVVTYLTDIVRTLLRNECEKSGVDELFSGRAWIDIAQLAWPLVSNGMIEGRTIESLAKQFNVKLENKDDTADVCTAIVSIYNQMMRRYKTALAGEEVMRDIGGETLEGIRKMVGF